MSPCFLKGIKKHVLCVSVESYETFVKVWENLKKLWKHSLVARVPHSISHSLKLPLIFLSLDTNTVHVFYFLNTVPRCKPSWMFERNWKSMAQNIKTSNVKFSFKVFTTTSNNTVKAIKKGLIFHQYLLDAYEGSLVFLYRSSYS